jgi:hypothetical protein
VPDPRLFRTVLSLVLALMAGPVLAQDNPLDRRARQLADAVCGGLDDPASVFDAAFLQQVPPATVARILEKFCNDAGPVAEIVTLERSRPNHARLEFRTERGLLYPVTLGIGDEAPHLVDSLWFGPARADLASWDEVVTALAALPGQVSFQAAAVGAETTVLAALEPERPLAVGSAFKLYVLGALAAAVATDAAAWQDWVPLNPGLRSLPSGVMQNWPAGSPVTLSTLALQMIAVSDNTATDHLIHQLGRERIEAAQGELGVARPDANRPFITTREMFLLKRLAGANPELQRWRDGDRTARRALLEELAGRPPLLAEVDLSAPVAIAEVEWFYSPAELSRAMVALRDSAEDNTTWPPLALLAVNPGPQSLDQRFDFVGFKGGSEPGVLCLSWLLKRADGRWFTLVLVWNDAEESVNQGELLGLAATSARLLAAE